MLDRHHLLIIRALQQAGTVTEAAKRLHLTQPALTHAIKKLEHHLGLSLWHKEGRNVLLSQAGELVLAHAERLLPQFDHLEQQLAQMAKGEKGRLRVGMECHPCYQWLLPKVAQFLTDWPQVDVDVKQKFQFGGIGALYSYEIDLLVTPDPLYRPGLAFEPVFDYQQVLVIATSHPLNAKEQIEPKDLVDECLICYPVEPSRLDIYARFLTPANVQPKQQKTIETTEMMLQLIAAGRGVGALPAWLVEQYQSHYSLTYRPLGAGMQKSIYLGYRQGEPQPDYLQYLVRLAREG